jgi:3-methyladenine DNA glycosylase AlkD
VKLDDILERIKEQGSLEAVAGMARFGITPVNNYGVSVTTLRRIAREIGKNHLLAEQLWSSSVHEARLLASIVDDPKLATEEQLERWVKDFNSWDVCDQCCNNLFGKTCFAYQKAVEWSGRSEEFVKRAGFVLMAHLAVHDKKSDDRRFEEFFPIILREAADERNFVKKAVNWALRQIGKRSAALNRSAIETAKSIALTDSKAARWIAADALRELCGEAVQKRLKLKAG